MKQVLVLLLAAGALVCARAYNLHKSLGRPPPDRLRVDGSFDVNAIPSKQSLKKFVRVVQRPPSRVIQRGRPIELTCEALGSPAPSIQWLRNDLPILEHEQPSTEPTESSPSSIARVNSTLIIGPSKRRVQHYTCLVTAGRNTAVAHTTVYSTGISSDLSERHRLYPLRPRIVGSYKLLMDSIGSEVILPCRARGHPRPRVSWWDNNGELVGDSDGIKVLRSGGLLIPRLEWGHMGEFTCRATNVFGEDSVTAFVYPVAV